jgi:radical SAM/Cys-rich protein
LIRKSKLPALARRAIATVQVNLGYRCNQSCVHCHVGAGPNRIEQMSAETAAQVREYLFASGAGLLDLTGGAPELNANFRELVAAARARGIRVIDRCNLTVLFEPGQEDLAGFLADNGVEITASLPCYLEENVDAQRGSGVFGQSIRALRRLNELGYGSRLELNLVYNPQGAVLPPPQEALEDDYRHMLGERYGIVFSRLLTLANMPIQRFGSMLVSKGQFASYLELLQSAHRDANLDAVMCRDTVSIDWRGYLHDCDFNQMLDLPVTRADGRRLQVAELDADALLAIPVRVADHCYGCTAGQGSSCGGALDINPD